MEFLQLKALFKEIPAPRSTAFPGGTQRTSAVMHRPSTGLCTVGCACGSLMSAQTHAAWLIRSGCALAWPGYRHANTGWSKCDTLVVRPCRATWQNW
jgi:hypothetical protein